MFISTCLAEVAEVVEEAVETATHEAEGFSLGRISIFQIALVLIGLYELGCGLLTLFNGKLYGHTKEYEPYTPESVQANSKLIGIAHALLGLIMLVVEVGFVTNLIPLIPTIVICALLLIIFIVISVIFSKRLIKK